MASHAQYAFISLQAMAAKGQQHVNAATVSSYLFSSTVYSDPNFPLTEDGRVHHLNVKPGEGTSISATPDHSRWLPAHSQLQTVFCPLDRLAGPSVLLNSWRM